MSADSELITMREAARRLGLVSRDAPSRTQARAAKRLRKMLEDRQRARGIRVVVETESLQSRCVTVSGIRAALPELRRAPRQIDEVRNWVATMQEKIDARCIELTEPRFADLEESQEVLSEASKTLARLHQALERRVSVLESRLEVPPGAAIGAIE